MSALSVHKHCYGFKSVSFARILHIYLDGFRSPALVYLHFICLYHEQNLYRYSSDPETSMGLVQHEGGPCGVLATIQVMF